MTGCKPSKTRKPSRNTLTPDEFHEALHSDLGKTYDKRASARHHRPRYSGRVHRPGESHDLKWATATINPRTGHIKVDVAIKFQNGGIQDQAKFERLRSLAKDGINRFWSKNIKVGKRQFCVNVSARNRCGPNALPINLFIDSDPNAPPRGRNSGITFLTAYVIHSPDYYQAPQVADKAFQIVVAHEFGHSVLLNAGGLPLSWGHKGTSYLWQQRKPSAPSHPVSDMIDLMKYYEKDYRYAGVTDQFKRKKASEKDVKRLIWGAQTVWRN